MIDFSLSKKLSVQYRTSYPFPHIVIDNFFDEIFLENSVEELKKYQYWGWDPYNNNNQLNKMFSPWCDNNIIELKSECPIVFSILNYLNSPKVLNFLEELTGIKNLIPDFSYGGGGVHRITSGGKLSIHADYSIHNVTKLYRRINLLLYMNKDWKSEWEGCLELWSKDMSICAANILPIFNRVVIFNTTNEALHGHPEPLNTPDGVERLSLALYYFTNEPDENENLNNEKGFVSWKELPEQTANRKKNLKLPIKI
jgi:hypothetical protein